MAISAPRSRRRKLIEASGVPYTIVRATQFMGISPRHRRFKLRLETSVELPPVMFQPIAADDVAFLSSPRWRSPLRESDIVEDLAGPERAALQRNHRPLSERRSATFRDAGR